MSEMFLIFGYVSIFLTIVLLLYFIYVKLFGKKKNKSLNLSKPNNVSDVTKISEDQDKVQNGDLKTKDIVSEQETLKNDVVDNKKNKTKSITKVYISNENKNIKLDEDNINEKYDLLSSRAEFVSTDKHVAKFQKFSNGDISLNQEPVIESDKNVSKIDDCKICSKYFDKSRKLLSSVSSGDFDNMFANHIGEHYMNFDANKYINTKLVEEMANNIKKHLKECHNQEIKETPAVDFYFTEREKLMMLNQNNFDVENKMQKEYNNKITLRSLIVSDAVMYRKIRK